MKPSLACLSTLLLAAACGGSDDPQAIDGSMETDAPPASIDAAVPDAPTDGPDIPMGPATRFVTSAIDVPENAAEAMALGLDIDDRPNDGPDNQLGMVLGVLGTLAPELDAQLAAQTAMNRGETILLMSFVVDDQSGPPQPAALATFEGTTPNPAPCDSPADTVCANHLAGTGTFAVGTHVTQTPIVGTVTAAGTFTGGVGTVVAPITFGVGESVWLPLQKAKAQLTGITATGFTGKLGGAISQADVDSTVIPAIASSVRTSFDLDCDVGGIPPSCGCTPNSAGETLASLFDHNPTQDCVISDAEVETVVDGFLTPDIDLDGNGTNDAISIGVGVTVVPGEFTPP